MSMFKWETDADKIVTITMDDPNQPVNTMNSTFQDALPELVEKLKSGVEAQEISGVIITSAKKTFFAGGDIKSMIKATPADAEALTKEIDGMKAGLRAIETLGVPVVAAMNGTALGGGLEIALATHHRIATDAKGAKFGLPEVTLGLLPGGGGVTRVVRMLGIQDALMKVLTTGRQFRAEDAVKAGLMDEVVPADQLLDKAKEWIKANPEATQPWDQKGFKIPGGTPSTPALAQFLPSFPANVTKQIKGAPMPAPKAILKAAVEGAQLRNIEEATAVETRYFVELVTGPTSKNMMQAFFFDLQYCNGGGQRPEGVEKKQFKKLGMVGAGMMGAAIAYVAAKAGMEVVLKDIAIEAAEKGKNYSEKLEAKALERGKTTKEKSEALLNRITPSVDYSDLSDCDIVIEAVFENTELKHKVWAEIEAVVPSDCVLGSNTSTLPITELATGVKRPEAFIGIHFFSPVDKMPLVEIIRGEKTDDETLAAALDFTSQIRKTPIVVNDSRGFYTSRVIGFFLNEAMRMLAEGIDPAVIEAAGRQAGYPAPPLQLQDELNLKLARKIGAETKAAQEAAGISVDDGGVTEIVDAMLDKFDRPGKLEGRGFYEYNEEGRRAGLWRGLWDELGAGRVVVSDAESSTSGRGLDTAEAQDGAPKFIDLVERMLFAEALETQKCLDEGVLMSDADANIGSILGIGFPAWTGGTRQYIKNYARPAAATLPEGKVADVDGGDYPTTGVAGFVARAAELTEKYGERFEVPESLKA
ncbi:3-hydroxyacyl-CoA dehydrogenase [Corynebacterium sp. 320]|uniref:3-hydroxyacyl-CoA dehydrogenase NAD-binding domain-containing protein n=1 Tax=Corynebacterium TaxID=1716 RepID=UPI00125CAFED|nr:MULTISPECIES: 3-hydroxyacyl-CoA dehydrogenase NAD-binding domain-containing protein [Corynebacterium]KAB1503181.1 3-hydroxyacyl-CoA dehydrogenase [Corynebacterium sp. 320]KAB1550606.1 3-hydroxyacyl-CoA dehydrogenase [Corynebacterium sp. 321]KAB1550967.1 3-hydroxyacyl-CoA dehydrogenase [Corynebacterium sp. 319]KAB3526978.1 3-hydroxyacyl-CoA dehydrogenase [Corynebacterium sp. 250]KAB3538470.1 3-hydroxyacyl-CoA dehydrogenase [Corynebacterium sp. 366]